MRTTKTQFQQGGAKAPMGPLENIRFTWKLLRDPRVAPYAKMVLPILAIIYLISPIDLIPDMILGLGQMDDAGVIAFLGYLLVSFVRRAGWSTMQEKASAPAARQTATSENVIDATYRVVSDPGAKRDSNIKS